MLYVLIFLELSYTLLRHIVGMYRLYQGDKSLAITSTALGDPSWNQRSDMEWMYA